MLAGPVHAEDLVQEAVIATFSRSRGFTDVAQAEQYVRRAIASKYVDSVRRDATARAHERRGAGGSTLADHADAVATGHALDAALAKLPPRVRACIVLRYLEDLSIRDTATTLGLSEGSVKRYVSDGLHLLNGDLGMEEKINSLDTSAVVSPKGGAL